ncbi:MAG: methyltransferase domain-containing protein [Candidatus Omnitrophica bacterium]|nr:methyltransferase domain-containing protein [Candidatus Omnitrophota bacterium]
MKKTYATEFHCSDVLMAEQAKIDLLMSGMDLSGCVESYEKDKVTLSFFEKTKKSSAKKVLRIRKATGLSPEIKVLYDSEWKGKWKEGLKPFYLTENIQIIPGKAKSKKVKAKREGIVLYIDTDIIFGSGLHPTTRMMAEFIESKAGKISNFFDIGTGTGILALIAAGYGAGEIWAIDVSEDAVKNASANFRMNGVDPDLLEPVNLSSFHRKKVFDFVSANLLTADLVKMKNKIVPFVAPGGYLAVSGVSKTNYNWFREHFRDASIRCVRVRSEAGWSGLLFKKNRARS